MRHTPLPPLPQNDPDDLLFVIGIALLVVLGIPLLLSWLILMAVRSWWIGLVLFILGIPGIVVGVREKEKSKASHIRDNIFVQVFSLGGCWLFLALLGIPSLGEYDEGSYLYEQAFFIAIIGAIGCGIFWLCTKQNTVKEEGRKEESYVETSKGRTG